MSDHRQEVREARGDRPQNLPHSQKVPALPFLLSKQPRLLKGEGKDWELVRFGLDYLVHDFEGDVVVRFEEMNDFLLFPFRPVALGWSEWLHCQLFRTLMLNRQNPTSTSTEFKPKDLSPTRKMK